MNVVSMKSKQDPRLRWFDEARFGMFIHFGLYALLERGEWAQYDEHIPRPVYERLARRFNPRRFRAEEWVRVAESGGARYITVTAKHHDGFCLWDSKLTDFKITRTPFKRDLLGELVEACHRRGMRIVLYYSQPDWHHPNFVNRKGAFKELQTPPGSDRPDWPAYRAYCHGQVRELVTRYGRVDGIWFDGSHRTEKDWGGRELYRLIKSHQPHAVVNDRARCGDFYTPERSLPDDLTGCRFEACESIMASSWGAMPSSALHSVPHLIESLVRMAAAGGNYLLNVGPRADGTIPEEQALRMRLIGDWLRRNGQSIYGAAACPLQSLPPGCAATRKGKRLFLHLLRWPLSDRLPLPSVRTPPARVDLLGGPRLPATAGEIRALPPMPADGCPAVVRLQFRETPRLLLNVRRAPAAPVVTVSNRRPTPLPAGRAARLGRWVKGAAPQLRQHDADRQRGRPGLPAADVVLRGPEHWLAWTVQADAAGQFRVGLESACTRIHAGSRFVISCGRARIAGRVPPTRDMERFTFADVGVLRLPEGRSRIVLRPTWQPFAYVFAAVAGLRLTPVSPGAR